MDDSKQKVALLERKKLSLQIGGVGGTRTVAILSKTLYESVLGEIMKKTVIVICLLFTCMFVQADQSCSIANQKEEFFQKYEATLKSIIFHAAEKRGIALDKVGVQIDIGRRN